MASSDSSPPRSSSGAQDTNVTPASGQPNIDSTHYYRQGFPAPLAPLPLRSAVIAESEPICQQWPLLRPAFHNSLKLRAIQWTYISVLHRRATIKPTEANDVTIHITAERESDDRWILFLKDVYKVMQDHKVDKLIVELYDPRGFPKIYSSIIQNSDVIVQRWPELRTKILEVIEGQHWVTLSVLRRGPDHAVENNHVTVVLRVVDPSSHFWVNAQRSIKSICQSVSSMIDVELVKSGPFPWSVDPSYNLNALAASAFEDAAPMGSSVGLLGGNDSGSGTLGGLLLLTHPNKEVTSVGLTNFHVVRSNVLGSDVDRTGIQPGDQLGQTITLVTPSDQDTEYTEEDLRNQIEQNGGWIESCVQRVSEEGRPKDRERLERLRERLSKLHERIRTIDNFDRNLGHVLAASGFRRSPGDFLLDWALVRVHSHRMTTNQIPSVLPPGSFYATHAPGPLLDDPSMDYATANSIVWTNSRSTGLARGKLSAIQTSVNVGIRVGSAWEIVGSYDNFCGPEYSGSFVLDCFGGWCGLLFGSHPGTNVAFMIPVDELIADIEASTGATVSLP